jgi:hypothetical protein
MNNNRSTLLFRLQVIAATEALLGGVLRLCGGAFRLINRMTALLITKRKVAGRRQENSRLEAMAPDFDPSEELDPTRPFRV